MYYVCLTDGRHGSKEPIIFGGSDTGYTWQMRSGEASTQGIIWDHDTTGCLWRAICTVLFRLFSYIMFIFHTANKINSQPAYV